MNLKKDLKKLNKLKMNCEKIRVIPKLEIKNNFLNLKLNLFEKNIEVLRKCWEEFLESLLLIIQTLE